MTNESKGSRDKAAVLLTLLQSNPTDTDCDRCAAGLTTYVDVQFAGEDYQNQYPFVAQHLDSCVSCAEAYARVYEVVLAERNGRLPQPAHIPEPDLSFLSSPTLWAVLQTALQQTQERLTLQLDTALAALLAPQPSLAITRSGEDGRFGKQLLSLTPEQTPETGLPFSLSVYADTENPDLCLVEITVEPPGLSWPDLGGREVGVSYEDVQLTAVTDDWGTAVFTDIPRPELKNLRLEIILRKHECL